MSSEYSISREIKRLRSVRGYGTELISIYVPAGFQLSEEISKLKEEYSQSSNIKSKSTRGNVQSAIDKIIQYLRLYRETPKNGLVVFCGNLSDNQSKADIELFSIEPPLPLKVNIYRCDSTFMLDPLELLVDNKDTYALLVMDGREATVATLKGAHIQVFKKMNSTAHAKVRKGGAVCGQVRKGHRRADRGVLYKDRRGDKYDVPAAAVQGKGIDCRRAWPCERRLCEGR